MGISQPLLPLPDGLATDPLGSGAVGVLPRHAHGHTVAGGATAICKVTPEVLGCSIRLTDVRLASAPGRCGDRQRKSAQGTTVTPPYVK